MSASTYKIRFEFRVSAYFAIEAAEFGFDLDGRSAVLKSVDGRPLKESDFVAIHIGGFDGEHTAREFGLRLQRAATWAGTKTGLGVDIGDNRARTAISEKLRQAMFKESGVLTRDRIHGIDVYDESIPTSTIILSARATVSTSPLEFTKQLDESFRGWFRPVTRKLEQALRLRAEANLANDNLAKMILAVASVEALTPDEFWTEDQTKILDHLAEAARGFTGATAAEIEEVIVRITGQRKLGVNQGFRRLFQRIGTTHLWSRWRDVYGIRSRILHGDMPPAEVRAVIDEALALSREIVLTAAESEISGNLMPVV